MGQLRGFIALEKDAFLFGNQYVEAIPGAEDALITHRRIPPSTVNLYPRSRTRPLWAP